MPCRETGERKTKTFASPGATETRKTAVSCEKSDVVRRQSSAGREGAGRSRGGSGDSSFNKPQGEEETASRGGGHGPGGCSGSHGSKKASQDKLKMGRKSQD